LLQKLVAQLRESVKNLNLLPDRLDAYKNAYIANKKSQYFSQEEFKTSSAALLDLLQTERDFLDASESLIETLRSSEIQKYSYLQLTGELGDTFQIILD
jgi:outer membrane protein TolC